MPGSLARPQYQARRRSRNSQVCSPRSRPEDHGGDMTVQATVVVARPPSRGCNGKGAASCSWPSGRAQHGDNVGVADCHPIDAAAKSHRKHLGARAEAPARLAGADQAARARSTGRSSAVMAAIGDEDDKSPWSGGSAWRGGAHAP
jgi:hypothetical protein